MNVSLHVVSRPLDDLCYWYLDLCDDHLSTQITERQGAAMLSSQMPSQHHFLSNLWGGRPLDSPSLNMENTFLKDPLQMLLITKLQSQRVKCILVLIVSSRIEQNWSNLPWTQPPEAFLVGLLHGKEGSCQHFQISDETRAGFPTELWGNWAFSSVYLTVPHHQLLTHHNCKGRCTVYTIIQCNIQWFLMQKDSFEFVSIECIVKPGSIIYHLHMGGLFQW